MKQPFVANLFSQIELSSHIDIVVLRNDPRRKMISSRGLLYNKHETVRENLLNTQKKSYDFPFF